MTVDALQNKLENNSKHDYIIAKVIKKHIINNNSTKHETVPEP